MSDALHSLHRLTLHKPGEHLFAALAEALPGLSRSQARQAVMAGLVSLDGVPCAEAKTVLGDRARVTVDLRHGIRRILNARLKGDGAPAGKPFTILYEDQYLIVVDKAAGVLSAPLPSKGTGEKTTREHLPNFIRRALTKRGREVGYLGIVHRLDKETSGCIVFALTREAQRLLSEQFAGHAAGRAYRAIVYGGPRNDQDELHQRIGRGEDGRRAMIDDGPGKDTVTRFRVLKRHAKGTELDIELETGRTHQIRVAFADIGCPVAGDRVYGRRPRKDEVPPPRAPRLMLHAHRLVFDHPVTGRRIEVEAPVPREFADFTPALD
jgi:23S rRNA pseudouridine1911/1915/1917 synthase